MKIKNAKIKNTNVKMANYLSLPHVKGEDGSAASPVGDLPCPRELLS